MIFGKTAIKAISYLPLTGVSIALKIITMKAMERSITPYGNTICANGTVRTGVSLRRRSLY